MPCFGFFGGEHYLAGSGAGRCGKSFCYDHGAFYGSFVEDGVQEFVEFLGFHALEHGFLIDGAGTEQVHGDFDHGGAGAFAVAGLEHPEFAVLDGEFHVLHVFVVCFQTVGDCEEFVGAHGHGFLERGIFALAFFFGDALESCPAAAAFDGDLLGGADAGYHVFALCVDEVFAVEEVFTGGCIAAEGNTGG